MTDVDDGISPEEWAWLESLPRRTLQNRVDYWDARHRLEDRPVARIRPYVMWRPEHFRRATRWGWFDTRCPPVV